MILTTNSFFGEIATNGVSQWYAAENGAVETEQNCIPIFYVLDDVQIHCDSDGLILGSSSSNVISNILNQNPGQINFFLSEIFVPSNPSATGFASNFGNYLAIERIDGGLIGHELGHVLGLNHTYMSTGGPFEFGCNDIWDTAWEWDMDGDGIVDLTGDRRWINSASHNGLDACDETNFAIPHPCCSWQAQNNNLMGGTAFSGNPTVAALTPCQIDKMLTNITCDLVSDVGCSSAKANIGILPNDGTKKGDCEFCIILESSFFESEYNVTIDLLIPNPDIWVPVFESGFQDGEAENICLSLANTPLSNDANSFRPGETYRVTLEVKNECSEDSESLIIDIPGARRECGLPIKTVSVNASPNPTTGVLTIEYNLESEGRFKSYIVDPLNPKIKIELVDEFLIEGVHTTNTQIPSSARNGVYYLIYGIDNNTFFETIIKQ